MVIGVCDDIKLWRDKEIECLERLKEEINEQFEYKIFESGEMVLEYNGTIDILLLDIQMSGMNGIETMRILENSDNVKAILFVSGYEKYVFDAFGMKTKGFICKPVRYEQISKEVKKIIHQWNNRRIIEIQTDSGAKYVDVRDILYVYAEKNYVRMYIKKEEYLLYGNLKYWEDKLSEYNIIRVHKSYLVNLEHVLRFGDKMKIRAREEEIPLGRKYKEASKRMYKEHLFEKMRDATLL